MKRIVKLLLVNYALPIYKAIISFIFRQLPIKNKVIFSNFNGKGFGDDPKYIAEALHEINPRAKIIWLVSDFRIKLPEYIQPVKIGSIAYFYHICTARCWCANSRGSFDTPKRRLQFYIQTWHCTLGLKDCEGATPSLPLEWRRKAECDSKKVDLMYSDNDIILNYYRNYFYHPASVIKCDVPRIAFMRKREIEMNKKVRSYYNIDDKKRIVLYAPTFRKKKDINIYKFDYQMLLDSFKAFDNQDCVLLLRLHPFFSNLSVEGVNDKSIIDATKYEDIQELICAADILITDFSACMFDALFLEKPVFLYACDFDEYVCNDRRLMLDIEKLPFPVSKSFDSLIQNISLFNNHKYLELRKHFMSEIGFHDDGKGDEYIANIINSHLVRDYEI